MALHVLAANLAARAGARHGAQVHAMLGRHPGGDGRHAGRGAGRGGGGGTVRWRGGSDGRRRAIAGRGRCLAGLADEGQRCAHLHRLPLLHQDLKQLAALDGRHLGVHLVGDHLQQGLVLVDTVADLLQPLPNLALKDALAQLGHLDFVCHGVLLVTGPRPRLGRGRGVRCGPVFGVSLSRGGGRSGRPRPPSSPRSTKRPGSPCAGSGSGGSRRAPRRPRPGWAGGPP